MTEKLYYKDAYIRSFEGTCIKNVKIGDKFGNVFDKTAFFPEGGGQKGDTGTVNGIKITDTVIVDGEIYHITDEKIKSGAVTAEIDWEIRFAKMQNHTAEHIVSGLIKEKFNLDNVGFHLGDGFVTADYNGMLSKEDIRLIETEANKVVWSDAEVKTYFPKGDFEKKYRSKKENYEGLRIVEIVGTDVCACCAPHVSTVGQIGVIKIVGAEKHKKGVRLTLKSGIYALEEFELLQENAMRISKLLSSSRENIACAVEKVADKLKEAEFAQKEILRSKATDWASKSDEPYFFAENSDFLKEIANVLKDKFGSAYVFSGQDGNYRFMALDGEEKLEKFLKIPNVIGGGRDGMRQGTVKSKKTEIISALKNEINVDTAKDV